MTPQAAVLIRLQDPELDEPDHGGLLDAGVRLFGAVGHQLGQQRRLLHLVAELQPQRPDHLSARGQEAVEHALAGAGLDVNIGIVKFDFLND